MMRALLAERFALKAHVESRAMPRYLLVTARSDRGPGPQLKLAACDGRKRPESPGFPKPGEIMLCGTQFVTSRPGQANIRTGGQPIGLFARLLTPFAGRIVIDGTGLTGAYDIDLTWTPELAGTPDVTNDLPFPNGRS